MEISVELDKRTGKSHVVSTATVTPDIIHGKGLKVYEDGRKSVYMFPPGEDGGDVTEMSFGDVEELLRQATDWTSDVHYHWPVYSNPYTGTSRPSTPHTSSKTTSPSSMCTKRNKSDTPSPAPSRVATRLEVYQEATEEDSNNIPSINVESPHYTSSRFFKTSSDATPTKQVQRNSEISSLLTPRFGLDCEQSTNPNKTLPFYIELNQSKIPSPDISQEESRLELSNQEEMEESNQGMSVRSQIPQKNIDEHKVKDNLHPFFISVKASSDGFPPPIHLVYKDTETSPLLSTHRYETNLIKKSMHIDRTPPFQSNTSKEITTQSKMPIPVSSHGEMEGSKKKVKLLNYFQNHQNTAWGGMSIPAQSVYSNLKTNSLRSTHKYEMDLIERSMNLDEASYTDSIKMPSPTLGESTMDAIQSNIIPTKGLLQTAHTNIPTPHNINNDSKASLVSGRASSEVMPIHPSYRNMENSPQRSTQRYELDLNEKYFIPDTTSPTYKESTTNSLVDELEPEAVTIIFMGFEKADEEDSIQAEMVIIEDIDEGNLEDSLSFHPNGYTSKVFQPTVGSAMVTICGNYSKNLQWDDFLLHKPTFMHQSGKNKSNNEDIDVGDMMTER